MVAQSTDVRPRISGDYKIKFKIELLPLKERIGGGAGCWRTTRVRPGPGA